MKNIDKKINTLINVINTKNPEKYFKYKYQDFCSDIFLSYMDEVENFGPAFLFEEDYSLIKSSVIDSNFIKKIDDDDELIVDSCSFAIFIFYSYTDFCMKISYLTERGMKKFIDTISEEYFKKQFPQSIFDFYTYIKKDGNSLLEKESISSTETAFPFFEGLSDFKFSFNIPIKEEKDKNDINKIGNDIKRSYSCYINTLCLSYSNFLNFLNSFVIYDELGSIKG